jgi:predicted Fe-Mo cluster-binding NifX family protein
MKVAMTVWGNRVSPVFDSAQTILLARIENSQVGGQTKEFIPGKIPVNLARLLIEKEIDILICGAISKQPAAIIESAGIQLVSFVAGNAEKLLRAYARGISIETFIMPGCSAGGRNQNRGGRPAGDSRAYHRQHWITRNTK